ncbi:MULTISPECIES: hypothetical protein [Cyanophyceae]|uniref:Uncharacterized protein n=1 Tax=Leptolyngbya subtilissima DQ-A4 TaxID=2933933 RepID=A0ABV0KBG7_9CYAN|nr:hypothetical protein [Nodosilinea sp. FACHB-141]MBD2115097.1 hypothetical protein [Nodosilinea sp. FACHB-141]
MAIPQNPQQHRLNPPKVPKPELRNNGQVAPSQIVTMIQSYGLSGLDS